MSYIDAPRSKPGAVEKCCSCPLEQKIPTKGEVDMKLEMGKAVPIIKHWCAECGLYLSISDQDHFFPAPFWVDNRPTDSEPVEDE